jgi:hypothetical protein
VQRREEEDKVWMASYHLIEDAALWYSHLEKMHGEPLWPRFVKHLNRSFGPTMTSHLAEIKCLKQMNMVKDYKKQFLTFVCRCDR